MSRFHNYNPAKVMFTWTPLAAPVTGIADGTFIKATRHEDSFKMKGGSDGETTRVMNHNRQGEVTLTLKQGAQLNAFLSSLQQQDEATGLIYGALTIVDISGAPLSTLCAATNAWIRKPAEVSFAGQDEETRVWIWDTDGFEVFIGGN